MSQNSNYPLLVDDAVYALTSDGHVVSVFQTYEDAVNILASLREEHQGMLNESIVRIPVTLNMDPNRHNMSPQDQQQLINNAHQLTAQNSLDNFNEEHIKQDQEKQYRSFYYAVRNEWRRLAWAIWTASLFMLSGLVLGNASWMTGKLVTWLSTGLSIIAMVGLVGGTWFADRQAQRMLAKAQAEVNTDDDEESD